MCDIERSVILNEVTLTDVIVALFIRSRRWQGLLIRYGINRSACDIKRSDTMILCGFDYV